MSLKTLWKACQLISLAAVSSIVLVKPVVSQSTNKPKTSENVEIKAKKISSITSILKNPVDGMEVTLRGKILKETEDAGEYKFVDDSGAEIVLEIEDKKFALKPNTILEIVGVVSLESKNPDDVEKSIEKVEIEVKNIKEMPKK